MSTITINGVELEVTRNGNTTVYTDPVGRASLTATEYEDGVEYSTGSHVESVTLDVDNAEVFADLETTIPGQECAERLKELQKTLEWIARTCGWMQAVIDGEGK